MSWAIPRFDHLVDFSGASHIGRVRASNEDVWCVDPNIGLFAVADGMGGHHAGEVAAKIAVDQLTKSINTPVVLRTLDEFVSTPNLETRRAVFDALVDGVERAHAVVRDAAQRDKQHREMGCTLDAVLLLGTRAFVVHVGDGRTYLSRSTTTILLTHDHTLHGSLVARGVKSPSQPPQGSQDVLTNAVDRKGTLRVEEAYVDLTEGDRILLCSDGVHGEIENEYHMGDLARRGPPDDVAIGIINTAVSNGGRDNATILVVSIGARRAERAQAPSGLPARDSAFVSHSTLFSGVPSPLISRALHAAVEVEFDTGDHIPRFFAEDRVGYVILSGRIDSPSGWTLGPSGVVYPECLAGGGREGTDLCKAGEPTRALRIRADDFKEVCAADRDLAASVYERLAHILARIA